MSDEALQVIYKSVVLQKLLYASSAWWGFTSAADRLRIESFIRRGVRSGFPTVLSVMQRLNSPVTAMAICFVTLLTMNITFRINPIELRTTIT